MALRAAVECLQVSPVSLLEGDDGFVRSGCWKTSLYRVAKWVGRSCHVVGKKKVKGMVTTGFV